MNVKQKTGVEKKMGIGAIGSIGLFQMYHPYVYNTNTLSAKSLGAIDKVNNDVSRSHIEQPENPYTKETENLIPRGQSANFADILSSQLQMGMNNAARIFGDASVFA